MATPLPSPAQLDDMSRFLPEMDSAIKALNLPPPQEARDPEQLIHNMRKGWSLLPVSSPSPDVEDSVSSYTTRDGADLRLCIYKPKRATSLLPLVVWYHGGGLCMGFPEMNAAFLREVALQHKCVVVAPQYRFGPEVKFPVPVEDGWDALSYVAAHAAVFGANPRLGFIIGGESAGARLAAVLSHQALDKGLPAPLTGTFLACGAYFDADNISDYYKPHFRSRWDEKCLASPFLRGSTRNAFEDCLLPDNKSPHHNAALAPSHAGLSKTYLQACGTDILRDDTFLYKNVLDSNGVETKLDVYPVCPHCFWFLLVGTQMGQKWKADSHAAFEWLLKA